MKPKTRTNPDFAKRIAVSMAETGAFRRSTVRYWSRDLWLTSLPGALLAAFALGWFLAILAGN